MDSEISICERSITRSTDRCAVLRHHRDEGKIASNVCVHTLKVKNWDCELKKSLDIKLKCIMVSLLTDSHYPNEDAKVKRTGNVLYKEGNSSRSIL